MSQTNHENKPIDTGTTAPNTSTQSQNSKTEEQSQGSESDGSGVWVALIMIGLLALIVGIEMFRTKL